jgi:hypothetical protein
MCKVIVLGSLLQYHFLHKGGEGIFLSNVVSYVPDGMTPWSEISQSGFLPEQKCQFPQYLICIYTYISELNA